MLQQSKNRPFHFGRLTIGRSRSFLTLLCVLCTLHSLSAFQLPIDRIQRGINSIKEANYCEDADYHTDGKRTVWVKSYKKWTPADFPTMQKEAPDVLKFLGQAIDHKRLDVLEQLLPNYYRTHGGVQAFAADVRRVNG